MRYYVMIGLLSLMLLPGCGILRPSPEPLPCDCGVAEKEMRAYMLKYFDTLEDLGNTNQSLKACREKR